MYQAKVNQTQQYSDSQGEHIVHEGKLIFISKEETYLWYNSTLGDIWREYYPNVEVYMANGFYEVAPIIISETEYIKVGDLVYYCTTNEIEEANSEQAIDTDVCKKVLALPEHFSDKHLQAIVDGKMKEGKVLIECYTDNTKWGSGPIKKIYLNRQNHITLFPAKQSLEDYFEKWYKETFQGYYSVKYDSMKNIFLTIFKAGAKWQQENN